ncbi:hypothetical protein ACFX2I_023159 [Malus domestica]
MSLGLFLPLLHHWRRLSSSSSLPLSTHPPTECSFFVSTDGDICSSTKTKTTEISLKCSSKSVCHKPLGNAMENKPSSSTFQQVKKKNPLCPAMVPKPVDNAKMVSNKATVVTTNKQQPFLLCITLYQLPTSDGSPNRSSSRAISPTIVSGNFPDEVRTLCGLKEMGLVMPCCIKPEEPEGSRRTWLEGDGFGDAMLHKTRRTRRKSQDVA